MKRSAVLLALLAACAPEARYLGASVPGPCTTHDVEGCLGWMVERDLSDAELDLYDDAALRDYVQAIADRLARGANLPHAPRVVIADHDGTYATSGSRIIIARPTIERLDTEAELAGVVAHELAHIEGHHAVVSLFGPPPDEDARTLRRDAEGIADERAVALLERAGYSPGAMARALRAVLDGEDDDHPLRADRIAKVSVLAGHRRGYEGRDPMLAHLTHMVVGHDSRLGRRIHDAWVIAALGLALDFADGDVIRGARDALVLRRDHDTMALYPIGAPWGRELAASLVGARVEAHPLGKLTIGTVPSADAVAAEPGADAPLAKLQRAVRSTLPQPRAGSPVAILERPGGALVIELASPARPALALRAVTAEEQIAAEPARIIIEHAAHDGVAGDALACEGRLLDDPRRRVAAGDPIKCADRPVDARDLQLDFVSTSPIP